MSHSAAKGLGTGGWIFTIEEKIRTACRFRWTCGPRSVIEMELYNRLRGEVKMQCSTMAFPNGSLKTKTETMCKLSSVTMQVDQS
jgi:hypothetical protein